MSKKITINEIEKIMNDFLIEKCKKIVCGFCMNKISYIANKKIGRCTKRSCRKYIQLIETKYTKNTRIDKIKYAKIIYFLLKLYKNDQITDNIAIDKKTICKVRRMLTKKMKKDIFGKDYKIGGKIAL
ncbi:hypothetical protein BDAP_002770 [Binucleata daphniae]